MRILSATLRGALLAGLLLPVITGCASVPSEVSSAAHLSVTYYDFKTDSELSVADETDPRYSDLYSKPRDNATVKLVSSDVMEEFVSFAAGNGFFEHARPMNEPDAMLRANSFRMVLIEADGKGYGFPLERGLGQSNRDAVLAFNDIQGGFVSFYNGIPQLQYISTSAGGGANYFDKERERILRENSKPKNAGGR